MFKKILPWAAFVTAFATAGYAIVRMQSMPRVGIVDNAVLLQQFSESIKAREEIMAERKKWMENTRVIEDTLKAVMEEMGKAEKSDVKTRKELAEKLQKWNKEYNDYSSAVQRMAPMLESEKLKPVLEKLNMYVQTWGREHGYDAILGTGTGGVILMREPTHDITSSVLAGLNELYKSGGSVSMAAKDSSNYASKDSASHAGNNARPQ